jgi:hypothetical protein
MCQGQLFYPSFPGRVSVTGVDISIFKNHVRGYLVDSGVHGDGANHEWEHELSIHATPASHGDHGGCRSARAHLRQQVPRTQMVDLTDSIPDRRVHRRKNR